MKRMIFSSFALVSVSAFGLGSTEQQQGGVTQTSEKSYSTLEELKSICHTKESDAQIMKFNSTFVCSEEKTFWVQTGEKRFVLENQNSVQAQAFIKDDRHNSDWWEVASNGERQVAMCPVMTQWKTTARFSVTIKSCDQLDRITKEASFCREMLAPTWAECDAERNAAAASKEGFTLPKAPLCEYEATGHVASCSEEGPVMPTQQAPAPAQEPVVAAEHHDHHSCSHSSSSESCASSETSCQSSSDSSCDHAAQQQLRVDYEIGASLRVVEVKRDFWHRKHLVVVVGSPVKKGSILDQLSVKEGDMISRVNDKRTKDLATFFQLINGSKKRGGKVKLELRNSHTNEKFVDRLSTLKP